MLQIIDQRWREHLGEMDYLREGINLRAMGQQDPLVAWQREGFEMFGRMIEAIDDDYLRYVMHVQVITQPADEPDLTEASYQAAEDPLEGPSLLDAFRATGPEAEYVAAGTAVPAGAGSGRASGDGDGSAPATARSVATPGSQTARRDESRPASEKPSRSSSAAASGTKGGKIDRRNAPSARPADPDTQAPLFKAPSEKLGRNEKCWCGSGKKYKLCHGAS